MTRVPNRILGAAISDEGSLIALLAEPEDSGLVVLSADFEVQVARSAPSEAAFVTVDPHGRYLAVGTRRTGLHFINRYGKPAGRLETLESLAHLCFVPGQPLAVGAAAFGMLVGIALEPSRSSGRLEPEILWNDRLMSNVGRLALNGEGGMILASCYTLGIQRFDLQGRNEGSYHLGGTVSHAVPDFPGRTLAAATLEGDLVVMNSAGNVRLAHHAAAARGRTRGRPAGPLPGLWTCHRRDRPSRLVRRQAVAARRSASSGRAAVSTPQSARTATGSVRSPDWLLPVVESAQQAETAVVAVVDDPPLVALFTSPHRLQLFSAAGQKLGQGPDLSGTGRILRTSPGWLAAATDRQILLCNLRNNTIERIDVSLNQLTHLAIKPDDFGLALVQERDRIAPPDALGSLGLET